ncbi:MAG: hypothetical protein P1U88_20490 [Thalassobaculaceae bacterium]|nr:hypothetical protein [Thalassobaculaceae bacterium]
MIDRRTSERLTIAVPVVLGLTLVSLVLFPSQDQRDPPLPPPMAVPSPGGETGPSAHVAEVRLPPPPLSPPPSSIPTSVAPEPMPARADAASSDRTDPAPEMADQVTGEALLRAVDAGQGPRLTLLWPRSPDARRRIATHLSRCAGLTVALMAEGRLWRLADPPHQPWTPDRDRISGIVRQADGADAGDAARIRHRHGVAGGMLVAVVARRFDARLLGGLSRAAKMVGSGPFRARAAYAIVDGGLVLADIRVDGRSVVGTVPLGRLERCG